MLNEVLYVFFPFCQCFIDCHASFPIAKEEAIMQFMTPSRNIYDVYEKYPQPFVS